MVNTKASYMQSASALKKWGPLFEVAAKREEALKLEGQMNAPDFWQDQQRAQALIAQVNDLRQTIDAWEKVRRDWQELSEFTGLAIEEGEVALAPEIGRGLARLKAQLGALELSQLLAGKYDGRNAIVSFHPGAGGLESQDWAAMLLRMYSRWAEKRGYSVELLDYQPAAEAGINSATLMVKGDHAFGYLKAEKGVHRLVRISPFDSSGRRHTSFASLDVLPEVEEGGEIEINPDDLRVDTYRSGGAGGQHVNTTDSAVRLTHIPTGLVVTCQNERSQHANRLAAMKILLARLADHQRRQQESEIAELRGEQREIAWGNQIRSYVFHPYNMVKDHRTEVEAGNIGAVMDGEIDGFIDAWLRQKAKNS